MVRLIRDSDNTVSSLIAPHGFVSVETHYIRNTVCYSCSLAVGSLPMGFESEVHSFSHGINIYKLTLMKKYYHYRRRQSQCE